jgi:NTE family protein
LDALLEDLRLEIEGISGASAGAMNAVLLADGYTKGGREGARQSLRDFWRAVASLGSFNAHGSPDSPWGVWRHFLSPLQPWFEAMSQNFSPYEINPLDINPLRNIVSTHVDFSRVRSCREPKVFVAATRVRTGKVEIFSGERVTLDALMASACLPTLYRAVEVEGDYFWDGGFGGNPALNPLIYRCESRDILLVQINPTRRSEVPTTAPDIMDRMNEIRFNAGLLAEMRTIDFVDRLLAEGRLDPDRYRAILLHRIDGMKVFDEFGASSKFNTDLRFIELLHERGRETAKKWLEENFSQIGKEGTVDIVGDYIDGLRIGEDPTSTPKTTEVLRSAN